MKRDYIIPTLIILLTFQLCSALPIEISTCQGLENIPDTSYDDYILTQNIDCTSINNFNSIYDFQGTFDGQGNIISNLHIVSAANHPVGLFSGIMVGQIRNLGLENIDIQALEWTGALAGRVGVTGIIENVYTTGTVTGTSTVGGLVGGNNGLIKNSYCQQYCLLVITTQTEKKHIYKKMKYKQNTRKHTIKYIQLGGQHLMWFKMKKVAKFC